MIVFVGCSHQSDLKQVNNPKSCDINYSELVNFLNECDGKLPDKPCVLSSMELHNLAEKQGIKCAIVSNPNYYHCFNLFHASDMGNIYVDATNGIIKMAEYINGEYVAIKQLPNQIQIQHLGNESDFVIHW